MEWERKRVKRRKWLGPRREINRELELSFGHEIDISTLKEMYVKEGGRERERERELSLIHI